MWKKRQGYLSSPLGTIVISLFAALLFALWTIDHFEGERRIFWLYYFVPIGLPFVAFLLDRAARWRTLRCGHWATDLPVVSLSLARAVWPVPLISGHTLFLAYALLTTRSIVARAAAAFVLVEVFYLKIFVWYDFAIWTGGWLVAGIAAFVFWMVPTNHRSQDWTSEADLNG